MTFSDAIKDTRSGPRLQRHKMTDSEKYEAKLGFAFISPWLIGFSVFYLIPMVASFVISLFDYNLATNEASFAGLDNWTRMLFDDPNTWSSLWVTLRFGLIMLPISMFAAFMLAVLLNSLNLWGRNIFRTLFYAPALIPFVAGALIWGQVLNSQTGWLNRIIEFLTPINAVGIDGIRWLDNPTLIPFTFTMIGIWGIGNMILINLAGLQGIPTALHEAAHIDGAGWWRRLWTISLPMVTPVIFYNLVLGIVSLLQYFLPPFVLNGTSGYPEGATNFFMIYFYQQAFDFSQMGYGAALAWFLFFFGLALTIILFGTQKYWVYYAGGD